MKTISVMTVILLLGTCGCSAQEVSAPANVSAKEEKSPAAVEPAWDIGKVISGETASGVFTFTNETGKAMTVTSLTTSCGCTGSEIKDKTLAPQQATSVTVRFKSKGYKPGPVKQFVYINTDDTEHPVFRYAVNIEVVEKKGE